MKKLLFLFLVAVALGACNGEDDSHVGTWELKEVLLDPGDGSGTFQAVTSEKTLDLSADGNISSNGNLCFMGTDPDAANASTGMYSIEANTITLPDCNGAERTLTFEINDTEMIIDFPCVEPCQQKYRKQ